MLVESLVIFGILLAIMVIFLRSNRAYALAAVPLLVLPSINILANLLAGWVSRRVPLDRFLVYALLNVAAVIASALLAGIFSSRFKSKPAKVMYTSMCCIFNIVLASIFIIHFYNLTGAV